MTRFLIYTTTLITALTLIQANIIIKQITSLISYESPVFIPVKKENKILGIQITKAIIYVETGGKAKPGLSGEQGVAQFLPETWRNYQKKYLATTTLKMTPENEFKVLSAVNEHYLDKGYTPYQLALFHNQGSFGKCRAGINKYGVKYDSCAYANKVVALIK